MRNHSLETAHSIGFIYSILWIGIFTKIILQTALFQFAPEQKGPTKKGEKKREGK